MLQFHVTEQAGAQHLEWPDIPGAVARLDLRVKHSPEVLGKLTFTASVYLNQKETAVYNGSLIDKIVMEAGYPGSDNSFSYKNSGTLLKGDTPSLRPLIWASANSGTILKTMYSSADSNIVKVKYKVELDLQKAAVLGIVDTFSSEVNIKVKIHETSTCLITISII